MQRMHFAGAKYQSEVEMKNKLVGKTEESQNARPTEQEKGEAELRHTLPI